MPFDVISSAEMVERDLPESGSGSTTGATCSRPAARTRRTRPSRAGRTRFPQFTLATQNVDGLHTAAGSRDVLELHGNVWRARCLGCGAREDVRELDDGTCARPSAARAAG